MPMLNPNEGWDKQSQQEEEPTILEGATYWRSRSGHWTEFDMLKNNDVFAQPYSWPTEPDNSWFENKIMDILDLPQAIAARITLEKIGTRLGQAAVACGTSLGYMSPAQLINRSICTRKRN